MTLHRRNPKRDANEAALVDHLQMRGALVARLSGAGVPDLLVGFRGDWAVVEVKAPRGQLTDRQTEWIDAARRMRLPVYVIRDRVEADLMLQQMAGVIP
jgi:hypothetical protein